MTNPKKVLLVDDSNTVLLMEQMILQKRTSYDVITARNGREAVQKALQEEPDLILMDVVMPQMTGFEACQEIRSQAATQHIPIIFVTTRGEPNHVETGYTIGGNDYVTKPINGSELIPKIRNLIGE
jgi:DNA-binding response OmpR family regulator